MNMINVNIMLYGIVTYFIIRIMKRGVGYKCVQCEYKATQHSKNVSEKSKHEGVSYECDKCEYKAT